MLRLSTRQTRVFTFSWLVRDRYTGDIKVLLSRLSQCSSGRWKLSEFINHELIVRDHFAEVLRPSPQINVVGRGAVDRYIQEYAPTGSEGSIQVIECPLRIFSVL